MKYFGTDGIRGKVGEKLTKMMAYKLGKALRILKNQTVVIGFDTRESKDILAYSVAVGAMSVGIDVIIAGVVPTPAIIYYSQEKQTIGVMITASHNPYHDNGLKVLTKGTKLSTDEEKIIEQAMEEEVEGNKFGTLKYSEEIKNMYLVFLNTIKVKTNKKIVIDCANGATAYTAPVVFKKLSNNLVVVANQPNGININNQVGSTNIEYLQTEVVKNKAFVGFAFDGDGDRVLAVDTNGIVYDGDKLVYIITKYLAKNNKLNQNTVVLTKMSNLGIINKLKEEGMKVVVTDVGDKYVTKELLNNNYSIGGENSGHIIMTDILKTGDGTLIAIIILKILEEENLTLSELTKDIIMYKNKLINLKVKDKSIINQKKIKDKIEELESELGNDGKIIVRSSGTENLVRISVMAKTQELVDKYINELVYILSQS